MASVLIAGADEGLGLETARQLVHAGHTVWLGSPDLERGRVAAAEVGARPVQLDVTSDESVAAAAASLDSLDVLVNSAGTAHEPGAAELTADVLRETFEADLSGVVRVLQAFLPLLERSAAPVVVNLAADPVSKAAVNVVTVQYAKTFPRLRINAVDPGVEPGVEIIERMAADRADR